MNRLAFPEIKISPAAHVEPAASCGQVCRPRGQVGVSQTNDGVERNGVKGDVGVRYAFDLIELNGDDLRRDPLRRRRPDRLRPCLQARPRRHCLEAQGLRLPFRPLARLAQNEKLGCTSREARRGRGLGQRPVAMKKHRINADPARRIYRKIARLSPV